MAEETETPEKNPNEVNVRLKDTGTTFYDAEQGRGVVAHRVATLTRTDAVREALRVGRLLEATDEEAAASFSLQADEQKQIDLNVKKVTKALAQAPKAVEAQAAAIKKVADETKATRDALEAQYKADTGEDVPANTSDTDLQKAVNEKKKVIDLSAADA